MTGQVPPRVARSTAHPVTAALQALFPKEEVELRLITPEEEARWNRLVRQHHYLKEHRLVGESPRDLWFVSGGRSKRKPPESD